jgi:sirohydrochlorin cobaltochelatase
LKRAGDPLSLVMPGEIRDFLGSFLRRGPCQLGQIRILPDYRLSHAEDAGKAELETFTNPHDAIEIARYDDAGNYRPLKTAPNLRHGWRLRLKDLDEVTLAMDFLYPAALGTALAFAKDRLRSCDLRDTLARQTGMYAVVRRISDEKAGSVIATTCNHSSGCLRRILWSISPGVSTPLTDRDVLCAENEIPLLCAEACNLLVAAGRKMIKTPTA